VLYGQEMRKGSRGGSPCPSVRFLWRVAKSLMLRPDHRPPTDLSTHGLFSPLLYIESEFLPLRALAWSKAGPRLCSAVPGCLAASGRDATVGPRLLESVSQARTPRLPSAVGSCLVVPMNKEETWREKLGGATYIEGQGYPDNLRKKHPKSLWAQAWVTTLSVCLSLPLTWILCVGITMNAFLSGSMNALMSHVSQITCGTVVDCTFQLVPYSYKSSTKKSLRTVRMPSRKEIESEPYLCSVGPARDRVPTRSCGCWSYLIESTEFASRSLWQRTDQSYFSCLRPLDVFVISRYSSDYNKQDIRYLNWL
jgi:hypothetical protein